MRPIQTVSEMAQRNLLLMEEALPGITTDIERQRAMTLDELKRLLEQFLLETPSSPSQISIPSIRKLGAPRDGREQTVETVIQGLQRMVRFGVKRATQDSYRDPETRLGSAESDEAVN